MSVDYGARLERVRAQMDRLGIELIYLPPGANWQWLLGLRRERPGYTAILYPGGWLYGAFVGLERGPILALPRMVAEFDLPTLPGVEARVLPDRGDPDALLREILAMFSLRRRTVAVEDRAWAVFLLHLQRELPGATVSVASEIFSPLRVVKDDHELTLMRRAAELTDQVMGDVLPRLRVGVSELEILTEIDYQLARRGAEATSFPTSLYVINPRRPGAMVEVKGRSTHPIEPGTAVPFDFGAVWEGYCSDFGRTVWVGEPPAEYRRTHDLVMTAQAAGIAALRAGARAEDADHAARRIIDNAGYGAGFRHRLGHGIGMDVHEPPFLTSGDTTVLRPGMCFTVEPSIILDDRWMVRVEDVVVVRDGGGESLNAFPHDLLVVA
ncbi:MAG: Xaa-Pro peptidase family protein [Armatimonadota bacterium]|nr:Xaa-Pro peptidase family protein [Armatimonadota bacterium]MDR7612123.1 Xaa-Pro peptidase family protein [Armatimonadota bacterium]